MSAKSGHWRPAVGDIPRPQLISNPLQHFERSKVQVPETHPHFQGSLPSAIRQAGEALADADVVVVVGAPLFRYYPYVAGDVLPSGAKVFQITDNPADNGSAWVRDAFFADPARACAVLANALPQISRPPPPAQSALLQIETAASIKSDFLYAAIADVRPPTQSSPKSPSPP